MLQPVNSQSLFIGIDLGGTTIACGAVTEDGRVLHTMKRATPSANGSDAIIASIADMIILTAQAVASTGSIQAVGLGCPGLIDPAAGICIAASNLPLINIPIAQQLSQLTGYPVIVDNDVRMYVYGEAAVGSGRGYRHVLGVTLGTGMASAFIHDGELFYGSRYMAGELGHIHCEGSSFPCNCGRTGCLETIVSATGIVRQAVKQLQAGRSSIIRSLGADDTYIDLTAAHISEGYDQGDALCIEVLTHTGHRLGQALAIAATLYSPDIIIVGGGASLAGERILGPAREMMQAGLLESLRQHIVLKLAELTDHAGVIGSALRASHLSKH